MTPLLLAALLAAAPAKAPAAPAKAAPAAPAAVKKDAPKDAAKDEADAAAKAKELFAWAQRLYKSARYAEAIAKFEETYAVRPHPVIYFNIGKCWEQLGETAKAMRSYKDYLRLSPDAKDKETVTDAIANLERRLKEKGLQQVLVYADPPSSRIEIDGKDLGTSPASIELVAGNHKLAVKSDGFDGVDRSFVVTAGRSTEMTITLRPVKEGVPPPPPPPLVDAPKSDLKQPTKVASLTPDPVKDPGPTVIQPVTPPKKGRTFTWVAAGVAVAGAGVGVGLGLAANGSATKLQTADPTRTRADADALVANARGLSTGANVSYGVAAAAAVTAVVLFFVEGR